MKDNEAAFACAEVLLDPVEAEDIAAGGGGTIAGDPGGKRDGAPQKRWLYSRCSRRPLR